MNTTLPRLPYPVVYFAYGSNLHPDRMEQRCPGAVPLGTAELDNHRVVIGDRGVATIIPHAGCTTIGVCWQLQAGHETALDRAEGVALDLYRRVLIDVRQPSDRPLTALSYVEDFRRAGRPRPGYLETILAGARSFGLPDDYVQDLELLAVPAVSS